MLISTAWRASRRAFGTATLCFLASVLAAQSLSQAQAPTQSSPASHSKLRVDHRTFDTLLRQHVVDGFVDYDAFARAPEFAQYLASLDKVRPSDLDEDERLAYWINVYNAFTIQLIVSHKETESIRNINKALGFLQLKGPWSEPIVRAAGYRRFRTPRMSARSSSDRPPQIPYGSRASSACLAQSEMTGHCWQMPLARSIRSFLLRCLSPQGW